MCPGTPKTSVAGVENLRGKRQRAGYVSWALVGTLAFTLLALEATRGLGLWVMSDLTGFLWLLG